MLNFVNNFQPLHAGQRDIGNVVNCHLRNEFTSGVRRPYLDSRGRACITVNTGETELVKGERVPIRRKRFIADVVRQTGRMFQVWNAVSMRKGDWIEVDTAFTTARRKRLIAWSDLMRLSKHPAFDGWSKMTLEYEAMSDPGSAIVDMDATGAGQNDQPLWDLRSIPLPITHTNFTYSKRRLDVANGNGTPLSMVSVEAAGRRNGEVVEQTTIGTTTGVTYGTQAAGNYASHTGTSTNYGYTNFTYRVTKTDLTTPTGSNPENVMTDFLEMIDTMRTNSFFGPFHVYTSTSYDRYLDDDYFRSSTSFAAQTLRQRLLQIKDIIDIKRLDYLTSGYQVVCAQIDSEVVQAVEGMPPTVVQWDSPGGFEHNFKGLEVSVALLKAPYSTSTSGILHGTTS